MHRQQLQEASQKEELPNLTGNDKKAANKKAKKSENHNKINDEPSVIGEISIADYIFSIPDLALLILAQASLEGIVALSQVNKTLNALIKSKVVDNVRIYTSLDTLQKAMEIGDKSVNSHYIYDAHNTLEQNQDKKNTHAPVANANTNAYVQTSVKGNVLRNLFSAAKQFVKVIYRVANDITNDRDLESGNDSSANRAESMASMEEITRSKNEASEDFNDGRKGTYAHIILASKGKRRFNVVDDETKESLNEIERKKIKALYNPYRGCMIASAVMAGLSGVSAIAASIAIQHSCPYEVKTRTYEEYDRETHQQQTKESTYKVYHCPQEVLNNAFGPTLGTTLPTFASSIGATIYFSQKRTQRDTENEAKMEILDDEEAQIQNTKLNLFDKIQLFVFSSSKNDAKQISNNNHDSFYYTRYLRNIFGIYRNGYELKAKLLELSQPQILEQQEQQEQKEQHQTSTTAVTRS